MRSRRLLTQGPEGEPLWVCVYGHPIGDTCAAMLVAEDADPPLPGELKGMSFFTDTPAVATELALRYVAQSGELS
jgi:hypothetical protein